MAKKEHLNILGQGELEWNAWRQETPHVHPDLSEAKLVGENLSKFNLSVTDLSGAILIAADLSCANLRGAKLGRADVFAGTLQAADLSEADLKWAKLREANLTKAILIEADLNEADLSNAKLCKAELMWADLRRANLRRSDLTGANLRNALISDVDLSMARLRNANFDHVRLVASTFGSVNLGQVNGLETVEHSGPSIISFDTLYRSQGNIPEEFLRGAGVPEDLIVYLQSKEGRAVAFYSCFISYSSKDLDFVKKIHTDLQNQGVRCWYADEDLKIGELIDRGIGESIQIHDKLLLILSEHSVNSTWVEKEVKLALKRERNERRLILFPIRLDDAVMEINVGWPAAIQKNRHIGNFRDWNNHDSYEKAYKLLLRDLKAKN